MNNLIALVALAGFVLSLAVHISALMGVDVATRMPFVWVLHAGIFVVFIPLVISSRKVLGAKPGLAELRAIFPRWVVTLGLVIFAYAIVNFVFFMFATEGGGPAILDGKYVLQSHGRLIRELGEAEYHAFRANEIRGFSGHWLVFYYFPLAYFMLRRKSSQPLNPDAPPGGAPVS